MIVAVIAVMLLGAIAAAQQQNPPRQPPVFRSGVQIVEIDARVFDRDGRFVADLTRDDVEVLEDGKTQAIQSFYLVRDDAAASQAAADTPPPPGASAARPPLTRQTWIFFFDLNHLTPGGGFDRARKAVEDFIAARFRTGDVAGVLAGDKMINNRLTSVREELLAAVAQVKPRSESATRSAQLTREWPRLLDDQEALLIARHERDVIQRAVVRACQDDPSGCPTAEVSVMEKGRRLAGVIQRASLATMSALNTLAGGLARIPGPKTIVLLSNGFAVQDVETTLRSVVGQAARAGARVYAIDVRGLGRVGGPDPGATGAEYAAGPTTTFDIGADAPNSLAADTGGMMIRNENNIGRALDAIAADSNSYYVIGFAPSNTNWDGRFRAVQVRVKREAARVRARKGYLALEPARLLSPQPVPSTEPRGGAAEPAPERKDAPPPPTERAPAPADVTAGTVVAPAAAPGGDSIRLRPDATQRIRELAGTAPAGSDAATKGWDAYQRGDLETAVGVLEGAAAAPGARPWVLYALGFAQAGLGRPQDAIASWERVRRDVPDFPPVYMDLAATYASLSDLTSALAVLRDAERRRPNDPEIHNAVGVIHFRRGALDEAIAAFGHAIAAAPDDALAYMNLGRAYEARYARSRRYVSSQRIWTADEGDRRKAVEQYQTYIRLGGPYVNAAREALQRLEWSK